MLAGYVGLDSQNAAILHSLRCSLRVAAGTELLLLSDVGLLAPQIELAADGTITCWTGDHLDGGDRGLCSDGHWASVHWNPKEHELVLAHDAFGGFQLYYALAGDTLWFSTSMQAMVSIPAVASTRELDLASVHAYLALSYVPAPRTLIRNVRCVPPLSFATFRVHPRSASPTPQITRTFRYRSTQAEAGAGEDWGRNLAELLPSAVQKRLPPRSTRVAVTLSGGVDSAAVAAELVRTGRLPTAFHISFGGVEGEELPHAELTARHLGIPLEVVTVSPSGKQSHDDLVETVQAMESPYGDPVTLPLWLVYRAIAKSGFQTVFNGEGGDQLFAGWPNKAMFAAALYGHTSSHDLADAYLRSFHHFYGQEERLYGPELQAASNEIDLIEDVGQYLVDGELPGFFERLRWTNYWTKGSQNILPRAAQLARSHGLSMQAPLFDLALARFAITIPGELLLDAASEKHLLKAVLTGSLPPAVLARPKRGMGVPATDWCLGPLRREMRDLLEKRLCKRGFLRRNAVRALVAGEDAPSEVRSRRVGEKAWQLAILELWLEHYLDRPHGIPIRAASRGSI